VRKSNGKVYNWDIAEDRVGLDLGTWSCQTHLAVAPALDHPQRQPLQPEQRHRDRQCE
jgi:hypothetical protein